MAVATHLSDEEVRSIAEEVFRRELAPFEFGTARARSGFAQDGDPALFVSATFKPDTPVLPGSLSARVRGALHDELLERGESRYPYIKWIWPDEDIPEDDALDDSA